MRKAQRTQVKAKPASKNSKQAKAYNAQVSTQIKPAGKTSGMVTVTLEMTVEQYALIAPMLAAMSVTPKA
jgi:hypothetical protein